MRLPLTSLAERLFLLPRGLPLLFFGGDALTTGGYNIAIGQDALSAEASFFSNSAIYGGIASRMGTPYLCNTLNTIIIKHIKKCLPVIRSKVTAMLYQKEKELASMQVC